MFTPPKKKSSFEPLQTQKLTEKERKKRRKIGVGVLVLLSPSVERFSVFRIRDFLLISWSV